MPEEDLKENGDACKECGLLEVEHFRSRGRGFKGGNNLRYDDERRDSDGQPLQAKSKKLPERREIIEAIFEMFIQFGF